MFQYADKIKFTKAVYHNFHPIPLPRPFQDGTGGMGRYAPEQGCIELYWKVRNSGHQSSQAVEVYLNAIMGCVYDEDEWIEYHEPISKPVGEYTMNRPKEKDGRFYMQTDMPGNPQRMDLRKLECDGLLESSKIFYAEK